MKIKLLLITTLLFSTGAYAQNMFNMASLHPADTSMSEGHQLAIRYPELRQISITADIFGKSHFDTKSHDNPLISGESQNARISSFFTIPITKWDGNAIGATIYHNEQFFNISDISSHVRDIPAANYDLSKSTLGLSLNFSRSDAIFHTPVIYSAVFTGFSDNLSTVRRFNFNGSVVFPLKHTADNYFALGALVQIDPSAPVPVLPIINYYKRLNGYGLELIVDLPDGISIKQQLAKNAWVYLGSNYNTYTSFFTANGPSLPARFSYNTVEIKNGPGFEYLFGKYLILGVSGGINSVISARAIAKGSNFNDSYIRSTNKATAYGEFHISILPF
jgi:hypothetical protein